MFLLSDHIDAGHTVDQALLDLYLEQSSSRHDAHVWLYLFKILDEVPF